MIKASADFRVVDVRRNTIWLEAREGEDKGTRISVPKRSDAYSEELQSRVLDLEESELITGIVVSKDEVSPNWYIASCESHNSQQL